MKKIMRCGVSRYKVESQYKNPDVFIKALKTKLEDSEAKAAQAWSEASGDIELTWREVQTISMSGLSSSVAIQCKVDAEVCVKGRITSIDRDEGRLEVSFQGLFVRKVVLKGKRSRSQTHLLQKNSMV